MQEKKVQKKSAPAVTRSKKRIKAYNTCCSQAVTQPGTEQARRCLTSVIRQEPVHSALFGRSYTGERDHGLDSFCIMQFQTLKQKWMPTAPAVPRKVY